MISAKGKSGCIGENGGEREVVPLGMEEGGVPVCAYGNLFNVKPWKATKALPKHAYESRAPRLFNRSRISANPRAITRVEIKMNPTKPSAKAPIQITFQISTNPPTSYGCSLIVFCRFAANSVMNRQGDPQTRRQNSGIPAHWAPAIRQSLRGRRSPGPGAGYPR